MLYFLFPFHVLSLVSFQSTGKLVNDYTVEHLEIIIIPIGIKSKNSTIKTQLKKWHPREKRYIATI